MLWRGARGRRGAAGGDGAEGYATLGAFTQPASVGAVVTGVTYTGPQPGVGAVSNVVVSGLLVGAYEVVDSDESTVDLELVAGGVVDVGGSVDAGGELLYAGPPGASAGSNVSFIVGSIGLTGTTEYMAPGYLAAGAPTPKDIPVQEPFTITGLQYHTPTAHTAASGETLIVSLRKNGSPESLALIIDPGDTTGDTAGQDPISFVEGDTYSFQIDKSGTILSSPVDMAVTAGIS